HTLAARSSKAEVEICTVNKDGFPTGPTGCHGPNDPNYIIKIPVSDVFYDPAIPTIGCTPLPPPATLMRAVFIIDLYEIQRIVLLRSSPILRKRGERAQELFDNYKRQLILGHRKSLRLADIQDLGSTWYWPHRAQKILENDQPGPDYKSARDWEKNNDKTAKISIHFNNLTIMSVNGNTGKESYITGGTINVGALPRKSPRKRKSLNESQAELDEENMNPTKMWLLESSGRIVEKVIYDYARTLKHESCLHSIINDADMKARSIFRKEDWEEILSSNFKTVPKIKRSITDLMKKHLVTDLSSFQHIIFKSFPPTGTPYSNEQHFDLNYINLAYQDDWKEIGRKADGKFRLNDSLKLSKMLRNMFVQLAKKCDDDEQTIGKLQMIGMLHSGNRFQLLTLDVPKDIFVELSVLTFRKLLAK
ncbi:12236_t:CDS:2, partial [Acaulospora morrowiae]